MSIEAKQRQESAGAYSNAFNAKAENPSAPKRAEDDYILTHYRNGLEAKPDNDDYDPEDDDISADKFGAKAIAGNIFSNKKSQNDENQSVREREERREQKSREEARRIAEWDETPVMVGGVQMTKAESLKSLQNVNKNAPAYAKWAADKGLIKDSEKDEFIRYMKRREELEKLERENKLTDAEKREKAESDKSKFFKPMEAAQAHNYQNKGVAPTPDLNGTSSSARNFAGETGVAAPMQSSADIPQRPDNKENKIMNEKIFDVAPLKPTFTTAVHNTNASPEVKNDNLTPRKEAKVTSFDMNA